eukprot:439334-Alexandrium_andersonii.AAC.1
MRSNHSTRGMPMRARLRDTSLTGSKRKPASVARRGPRRARWPALRRRTGMQLNPALLECGPAAWPARRLDHEVDDCDEADAPRRRTEEGDRHRGNP